MLQEVMQDTQDKDTLHVVAKAPGIPLRKAIVTGLVAILGLGAWLVPIPFLDAPAPPPPVPEMQDAGLRFAVALQRDRILSHRIDARRLPDFLREVGDTLPGLTYERLSGGRFVLAGTAGEVEVMYTFPDSLPDFLGDALTRLVERP